jgi:phosphonate degradation associated HDIG domain protein
MAVEDVAAVYELFDRFGDVHYGERVSLRDHARQCAALAADHGMPSSMVAAALLHDLGHLLEVEASISYEQASEQDYAHEQLAVDALAGLFGPEVLEPIALHVAAKRWRCTVDPAYHDGLSPTSVRSLELQGGPMSEEERLAFEAEPAFEAAVALRELDDAGKVDGLEIPELEAYRSLLEELATSPA